MSLVGPTPSRRNSPGTRRRGEFDGLLTSGEPVHLRPMLQSDIQGSLRLRGLPKTSRALFRCWLSDQRCTAWHRGDRGSQVAFAYSRTDPVAFGGITAAGQAGECRVRPGRG